MGSALDDRQAIVSRILADPPHAHVVDQDSGEVGVWSTEESCYRLIARMTEPDSRTLETGSGLSTALFAALGTRHRCVTPAVQEATRLTAYLDDRSIPSDQLTFDLESSHTALPRLTDEVDLVFIDGDHGFPMPVVDWFYAGGLLRSGGVLVVDDIRIAAVRLLIDVLDQDPGWQPLERTSKWAAFRRSSSGALSGGPWNQPAFLRPQPPARRLNRLRHAAGRARSMAPGGARTDDTGGAA